MRPADWSLDLITMLQIFPKWNEGYILNLYLRPLSFLL